MPTPAQLADFALRFNGTVGNLSQLNSKLQTIIEDWDALSFTGTQKGLVRTAATNKISAAIVELQDFITEINGF